MTFRDLIPLYDFSLWEQAVQAFFCDNTQGGGMFVQPPTDANREKWIAPAGEIAFFTAFQNAVFQKARPRVSLNPISYKPYNERAMVLDANSRAENRAFDVPLEFIVVTKPDYIYHTQIIAAVRAIVSQMMPVAQFAQIQNTGLNAFLTYHELSKIWDAGNSLATGVNSDKSAYVTAVKYNSTFAIRASAWPGGTQTT